MVSAVEPDGRGLGQTSTAALRGRKLFLWGNASGGQRWQDWLGVPGSRYLEIQAGVCTTQLEHDVLDGEASRSWTEAFVPLDLDPSAVSGDYPTAAYAAQRAVHDAAPPAWLAAQHDQWLREVADVAPGELAHTGSGWGRAELALRGTTGPTGTPFPEVDDESLPFVQFADGSLGDEVFKDMATDAPTLPVVSDRWLARLEAVDLDDETRSPGWWVPYAVGTARHLRGDLEGAHTAYQRSVELTPTAVALRGLALLAKVEAERAELYARALDLAPHDRRLAVEWLVVLRDTGRAAELVAAVAGLPDAVRKHGRVQLHLAEALAMLGEDGAALEILEDLEVPDLAEGEQALSNLFSRLRPGEPVPERLDFRMTPETGSGAREDAQ